ncbi:hypothetical protein N7495_009432 [Penicillium taxi]|uniref:uncharacterized protein n=1 Tax=Penicillium taxi TaxID=168475 RepID=UPI0025456A79|nr:uncharacterized protein N7495_009432 [Penicillium taxi]KAJ5884922.1 hypothetical protein N7495_009432 [Penicillium taxi]
METTERGPILQWLARVPETSSLYNPNCILSATVIVSLSLMPDTDNLRAPYSFKLPDALEISDTLPDINESRKFQHKEAVMGQSPEQSLKRTVDNQYERKPRHKIKDNRYEYKRPKMEKQNSHNQKAKKKRARQGRKHTMNDSFHASNVPRSRLTLLSNANQGIFKKGKASSPVNPRDKNISPLENSRLSKNPNFAFSEKGFMLRKRLKSAGSASTPGKKMTDQQRKNMRHQNLLIYSKLAETNEAAPTSNHKTASSAVIILRSNKHPPSSSHTPSKNTQMKKQDEHSTGINLDLGFHHSLAANPHFWPDTEPDETDLDCAIEVLLLNLLHVGLSRQGSCQRPIENLKNYCNLQDLKGLLKDRRTYWGKSNDEAHQNMTSPSQISCPQESVSIPVGSFKYPREEKLVPCPIRGAAPPHDRTLRQSLSVKTNSTFGQDLCMEQQLVEELSVRNFNLKHESCLETLDERFRAIVNSEDQGYEPTQQNCELHSLQPSWLCSEGQCKSVSICEPLDHASVDGHLHGQNAYEKPWHPGIDIRYGLDAQDLYGYMSEDPIRQEEQTGSFGNSSTFNPLGRSWGLTTKNDVGEATLPPGFWRQNRLY